MLLDEVEALDRPKLERPRQSPDFSLVNEAKRLIEAAERPVAIIGGAGWAPETAGPVMELGGVYGIPLVAAFRRQDAIANRYPTYAGNLGYGPNPQLVKRIRDADLLLVLGARLGEATTDGYTLVKPDHPDQTLIHVHPDPSELNRVYRADLAICADVFDFAEALTHLPDPTHTRPNGAQAHAEWLEWSTPKPREGVTLDLGQCVAAMRERLGPDEAIICNGAGNFSAWWHRYWHYGAQPTQLAPTAGAMGYGTPAAVAAALRHPEKLAVALAGDGDFMMNGQELATAIQHNANMLVLVIDNGAYGTIRMHQEREFPTRLSGTTLHNPDFAALGRAYGCWAETVEATADFAPALDRALAQTGVRLLHLKTDVEFITPGTTIATIRG
jgi:acetolactate synthase-1/2/3 large subunit